MRRLVVLVLGAFVLLTAGWVTAPAASACSCAPATTAELVERADVVFTGTLVSREVLPAAPGVWSSEAPAVHVFAVETYLKGTAAARQPVVSADSSASCGLDLSGDGPFLVHATRTPDGQLTAGLCGGTALADVRLVTDVRTVLAGGTPPGPPDPGMGTYEDPSTTTFLLLLGGLLALTLLVGGLAAREGLRADRRAPTLVLLTRD